MTEAGYLLKPMRRLVATVLAVFAAATATAQADTIVFRRGGDVWLMAPDGTGQRQVMPGELRVAVDGRRRDDPGRRRHGLAASLHSGRGARRHPTPATATIDDNPNETPTHVRISPDGARIAYDEGIGGDVTTLWTPATATTLEHPNQSHGQEALVAPSWIGNSDVTAPEGPGFWLYTVGGGDNSAVPWFSDPDAAWATGLDAAASRNGARVAVLEDDAADSEGTPTRVVLKLFSPPTLVCELPLEAADSYASASPTFSPDGSRRSRSRRATASTSCPTTAPGHQVVTLPGAWEPYWSPAETRPPASVPAVPRLTLAVSTQPARAARTRSRSASRPAPLRR